MRELMEHGAANRAGEEERQKSQIAPQTGPEWDARHRTERRERAQIDQEVRPAEMDKDVQHIRAETESRRRGKGLCGRAGAHCSRPIDQTMGEPALPGRHRLGDLDPQHHRSQHQNDARQPIEQRFAGFGPRVRIRVASRRIL